MNKVTFLRVCFLILGITLLVLGIINGDVSRVFLKATKICLECIGIG